jgi:chromatin segregation and condensation protein Rec8/ScpA/Scc1 (kleisin family)
MEIIVTFLAILDLVREGTCSLEQNDVFDEIELIHLGAAA